VRIACVGAGGVGGYLGVLLSETADVVLVDRGEHLRALRENGIEVRSRERGALRARLPATDDTAEVGPVDLVLYSPKSYDNASAIPLLGPLLGPHTAIVTLQNGVGNLELLVEAFGEDRALAGPMVGGGTRVAPGIVEHVLPVANEYIELGGTTEAARQRAEHVAGALAPTGVTIRVVDDIQKTLWSKLIVMASLSAVGCLTRQGTARWRDHAETRALYATLVQEAAAVGRAEGAALDDEAVTKALAAPDQLGPAHKTSLHADLERGERLEVEAIHGQVVHRGERSATPTPAFRVAYQVLRFADHLSRSSSPEPAS
jgi:2-dehydropantoate 2-reductase